MSNPLIKLENVSFKYPAYENEGDLFAVNDVSLEINEGEFVAILGHNGSGKSTTAKLINMVLTPEKGRIFVEDKEISLNNVSKIILCNWNRHYPADRFFNIDLVQNGFQKISEDTLKGSSHDKITVETYVRSIS